MADYLLPYSTKPPCRFDCAEIADGVYSTLKTVKAIRALSLPDPSFYRWAPASPAVRITFRIVPYEFQDPPSYARMENMIGEIECVVCYSAEELLHCPHIIYCRLTHELTHAIRWALVRSTAKLHNISHHPFEFCISRKCSDESLSRDRFPFMLHPADSVFQAGYWMQHYLFGGVLTSLEGSYVTDMRNPENTLVNIKGRAYFKIITTSPHGQKGECMYYKLVGHLYNSETGKFGPKTNIFHSRLIGW